MFHDALFNTNRLLISVLVSMSTKNFLWSLDRIVKYWRCYLREYLKVKAFDGPVIFPCSYSYLRSLYTRHSRMSCLSWVPWFSRLTLNVNIKTDCIYWNLNYFLLLFYLYEYLLKLIYVLHSILPVAQVALVDLAHQCLLYCPNDEMQD